ncbi:uncharacterized protein BDR25DRAFT_274001 [Lindgomyces ingoldianus]|uniref:Uncharacterized protein n=1 Tax=Lindgomyces ingoldianus TaxID=673940 RepID=A0ACB6Q7M3_9PLEO|nr:uncharacterized protein BDR25DRAFT_274001 [Lindgomyces ingoldianus]KAF2462834.1 hypothetical protein BDR25DRAFT_274001 [Lindgomyces ingoldianus]
MVAIAFPFFTSRSIPLALSIIHESQLILAALCLITVLFCLLHPLYRSAFVFALLWGWILSSITTAIILYAEHSSAARGTLNKARYAQLQLYKMGAATVCYLIGYIILASTPQPGMVTDGVSGYMREFLGGGHMDHAFLLCTHLVNWLFLWVGFIYSRVMREGAPIRFNEDRPIRLG